MEIPGVPDPEMRLVKNKVVDTVSEFARLLIVQKIYSLSDLLTYKEYYYLWVWILRLLSNSSHIKQEYLTICPPIIYYGKKYKIY